VKEQETLLAVGRAAERAQMFISIRCAHLSLCKLLWYQHSNSLLCCKLQRICVFTIFSYISPS